MRSGHCCRATIAFSLYEFNFTIVGGLVPAISDGSGVWEWLRFLRSRTKEEIEMVTERNPEIRKAADALYELSADAEVRYQYEQREKARRDTVAQADYRWNQERIALEGKIADKDAKLANMGAEIERLRAELQAKSGSPAVP